MMASAEVRVQRRPKPPQLQRRSRIVAVMRLGLPALAALLLAMLALWSQFGFDGSTFRLAMGAFGLPPIDSLSMSNPHFEGLDDKKRPFSLTAERATQADAKADIIDLKAPQADLTLEDGAWLALTAETGRYQRQTQLLNLDGQVNLFHDQGYELQTSNVRVDLVEGRATSNEAVDGQGPSGNLTAQGLDVTDGGKRILFLGHAHMLFYNGAQLGTGVPPP